MRDETLPIVPLRRLWNTYRPLILLGLSLRIAGAFLSEGYIHLDEHYQILEFASYKLGRTPAERLPWEFHERMRPALQPAIVFALEKGLAFLGIHDPFLTASVARLIPALTGFAALLLLLSLHIGTIDDAWWRRGFVWLSMLLSFVAFQNVRFSSEGLSGSLFFLGFAVTLLTLEDHPFALPSWLQIVAGFLLGLSFVSRYQTGFLLLGFGLWLLLVRRPPLRTLLLLAAGGVSAVLLGVLLDRWFYGSWVLTAWEYFEQNILLDKASDFGRSPWWYYPAAMLTDLIPPFSVLFLGAFLWFFATRPQDPLTWTILPFLLIHFLIPHKEARFLSPLAVAVPLVASTAFARWFPEPRMRRFRSPLAIFHALNTVLAAFLLFKPVRPDIPVWKFIYRRKPPHLAFQPQSNLYLWQGYGARTNEAGFYRPPGLRITTVADTETFHHFLQTTEEPVLLATEQFADPPPPPPGYARVIVFRTLPPWVTNYNINDWISRTRIITLTEYRRADGGFKPPPASSGRTATPDR